MEMISRRESIISHVILYLFAFFALYPFVSTLLVAFNPPTETVSGLAIPSPWSLDSFIQAWTDPMAGIGRSMVNSMILAISVVGVSSFLSILTGYAFGTMKFRGSKILLGLFILGLIVPYESTVIPIYYEFRNWGMLDNYLSMILPCIGGSMAFGTYWMSAFFRSFPRELIDSAKTDGANRWTLLWRVIIPTAGPPIFAMATILFIWTWNNLLLAIVMITNPKLQMAPAALNYFVGRQYGSAAYQVTCAGALLVALPVMLIYYVLQRRYGSDALAGALKG
jgi:raffinose/stachyose/melibiose transport system permease protein